MNNSPIDQMSDPNREKQSSYHQANGVRRGYQMNAPESATPICKIHRPKPPPLMSSSFKLREDICNREATEAFNEAAVTVKGSDTEALTAKAESITGLREQIMLSEAALTDFTDRVAASADNIRSNLAMDTPTTSQHELEATTTRDDASVSAMSSGMMTPTTTIKDESTITEQPARMASGESISGLREQIFGKLMNRNNSLMLCNLLTNIANAALVFPKIVKTHLDYHKTGIVKPNEIFDAVTLIYPASRAYLGAADHEYDFRVVLVYGDPVARKKAAVSGMSPTLEEALESLLIVLSKAVTSKAPTLLQPSGPREVFGEAVVYSGS